MVLFLCLQGEQPLFFYHDSQDVNIVSQNGIKALKNRRRKGE